MLLLHASASEAAGEGGDTISPILAPYPGLMIWTIVAFVIAVIVLRKFAFGPIQEALDRRRETINGALQQAERLKAESEALLERYEQQLAGARTEADGIVERARTAGDDLTRRVRDESEAQRHEQLEQTRTQVQAEVAKAMEDIRSTVTEMTVVAAEKVLRGSLDEQRHHQLVEQAVAELDFDRLQTVGGRR